MEIEAQEAIIYAKRQRAAVLEWNQKYSDAEKKYISSVNKLISAGTPEDYKKICEMFEGTEGMCDDDIIAINKIPLNVFKGREELSYLIQAVNIYYREREAEAAFTVFDHGNNLSDIIDTINEVRLLLFELEFFKDDDRLAEYVKNNNISRQMLLYLVDSCIGGFCKVKTDACYGQANKEPNRHAGKKVAFILCANNNVYMRHALYFISKLKVPCECEVEVFTIQDAHSMTSGYNEGMAVSDAKYKVYLHQDVMIVNPYFIYDILDIFENANVGMIGMAGAPMLSESKVMWYSNRVGKIYSATVYKTDIMEFQAVQGKYENVEVIDGLLMATQYDIPWREDLFDKWDMYDVSQSLEFHRKGYDVVIPDMSAPWCLHDDGFMNLNNYYEELDKMKKEYYAK